MVMLRNYPQHDIEWWWWWYLVKLTMKMMTMIMIVKLWKWLLTTPPWSDPAIERLVHVGQEPNRLPHCLLLLGGVHLIERIRMTCHQMVIINGVLCMSIISDDHKACLTRLPLHSSPWECNPDIILKSSLMGIIVIILDMTAFTKTLAMTCHWVQCSFSS